MTSPITAVCNTQKGAGSTCERNGRTRSLPNCWFDQGTIKVPDRHESLGKKEIPIFVHYASETSFCMPCCSFDRINDITMNDIQLMGKNVKQSQIDAANRNKNNLPSKLMVISNESHVDIT